MKRFDILSVGELNPDLILADIAADGPVLGTEQEVGVFSRTLGSSTAICTVRLARLGLKTAMVAKVGNDDNGKFCIDFLRSERINTDYVLVDEAVQTGVTVSLTYSSDRLLATYPGSMRSLSAVDVPDELLASARHLHVASFYLQTALQPGLASLFKKAKSYGLSTSLDTGWDPREIWFDEKKMFAKTLAYTDIFLPNEKELFAMTGEANPRLAARSMLAYGIKSLVLKQGSKGSSLYLPNAEPLEQPGYSVNVIDTTGAGDSFNAGFLFGFLENYKYEQALTLGNACGALAVQAVGGT
ncbi:MAG: sugar kinase, partial [Trueperaceae bacterium]|nr:sugar kinase [Trueperaceae bacterium]